MKDNLNPFTSQKSTTDTIFSEQKQSEAELAAKTSAVVNTLPPSVSKMLNYWCEKVEVLSVQDKKSRRNDAVFEPFGSNCVYGVEFKNHPINYDDIHETIVVREYTVMLRERYGKKFQKLVFVGKTENGNYTDEKARAYAQKINRLLNLDIAIVDFGNYVRNVVAKAITTATCYPCKVELYEACLLPAQLHALALNNKDWFHENWLKKTLLLTGELYNAIHKHREIDF